MGKYSGKTGIYQVIQIWIANELAESNRLKRLELGKKYGINTSHGELQDQA